MSSPAPTSAGLRRVLVVGAAGFLGRAVVRALVDDGIEVHGLVRDAAKTELVRASGGQPFLGDVLDPRSLRAAAHLCEAAVHLAAHPSRDEDERRVRVEGMRQLLDVADSEGFRRVVVGSGYWVYAGQSEPIFEGSPVEPRGESKVNFETEQVGLSGNDPGRRDVMVVRPGMVYGNGSWFRELATGVRDGRYRVVGDGANRWSYIALPDAATAFVRILADGQAGSVYNVVDGAPAPWREFVDFVAGQVGAAPPASMPTTEAVEEMGPDVARHLTADRPTANDRLRDLGWHPRFPTYRDGVPPVLRDLFPRGR